MEEGILVCLMKCKKVIIFFKENANQVNIMSTSEDYVPSVASSRIMTRG